MRLSTVLLPACALLQCAAANDAYLYTFHAERRNPSTTPNLISTDTALAITSRRLGVSDALRLNGVDEDALLQISQHGGYRQPLFSENTKADPARVLVRIQTQKPYKNQAADLLPDFKISHPSQDLLSLEPRSDGGHSLAVKLASREGVQVAYEIFDKSFIKREMRLLTAMDGQPIAEILDNVRSHLSSSVDFFGASIDVDFTESKLSQPAISSQINILIEYLQRVISTSNYQPTLLLLPAKSQLAASTITTLLSRRQTVEEELLDLDLTLPSTSSSETDNLSTYKSKNTTLPRRFPACFTSKSACLNSTNSCSGHGTCRQTSSSSSSSSPNNKCFTCHCTRTTIRTNADGTKKTTLWAGAACQKKDISIEFTLFAVFGVTMAMLIMGVVGMMYGMGSQELPSVIGAGVAGPSASGRK